MPERMRYFCMGNALVVDLIKQMGLTILDIEVNEHITSEQIMLML